MAGMSRRELCAQCGQRASQLAAQPPQRMLERRWRLHGCGELRATMMLACLFCGAAPLRALGGWLLQLCERTGHNVVRVPQVQIARLLCFGGS